MRAYILLAVVVVGGCSSPDPCAGVSGACIALTVRSSTVSEVDGIDLDAFATSRSSAAAKARLPVFIGIVPPAASLNSTVTISATGRLGGTVVGTGSTTVMVTSGRSNASIDLVKTGVGPDLSVPSDVDLAGADLSGCGSTDTDVHNCGKCGHDCTALPHVSNGSAASCSGGACVVPPAACASGYAHCSSNVDDGCEADLSQPSHCGSCTACGSGMPLCTNNAGTYSCTLSCQSPTPDICGSTCVNLQSDPQHCNTCGNACTYAHAAAQCASGACQIGGCSSGYADCVNGPVDGCETYVLGADDNNCGGCNIVCKVGQKCSSGTCKETQVTCSSSGVTCTQSGCYQAGRYSVSSGGGIAIDLNNARRLWTRTAFAASGRSAASSTCTTMALEGINAWRLPTYLELQPLQYMTGGLQGCPTCNPAIDQAAFKNVDGTTEYWTNDYNSSKGGYDTPNFCDGRNNYFDPGTGPLPFLCTHDPLP